MRHDTLRGILHRVRRRWRLHLVLRGAAIVLGATLVAFVASAWGLEWARFSPVAVTTLRWVVWGSVLALAAWFLVRPLLKRVGDEQVALYLEEHEPTLEAAIMGAVEASRARERGDALASEALLDRLVARAVEQARSVDEGRRIEQQGLYRASGALAGVTLVLLALLLFGPVSIRTGVSALMPNRSAAEVNPYSIDVSPGDITVARGSDQFVQASLVGFASEEVALFTRSGEGEPYRRMSMIPGADGAFEVMLLDLDDATDYFVESDGIRSGTFHIDVADLPYVDRMQHEYHYPAYTGMEPRVVEDAGDVAALPGTEVRVTITPTLATPAGRLEVGEGEYVPLEAQPDGSLTGTLKVQEEGYYQVDLAMADGTFVEASPQYTIDLLSDAPPAVRFTTPGRDSPASPIEEVYLEAQADDDYGVDQLLLVYSVNGEAEDTVALHAGGRPLTEVTAGHTLYLEEFEVEPGDVVSYYGVARDRQGRATEAVSDIYFVNVQPFGRDFKEGEQQGGPPQGGQGAGAGNQAELSQLQRQVIAATFNLNRDRDRYSDEEFGESTVSVALAQGRVREQVSTLVERMTNRGLAEAEDQFKEIAEMLPEAMEAMETAEADLRAGKTRDALSPEQQALRVLQKAEETYERYVANQQQSGGGGGGGGNQANAEDLADLFELELDKLENQYETVQRGERQQANAEVDEVLEKLDELARRQQAEGERQRARAQQGQTSSGGQSAAGQRELADQAEEAARQLQRLARQNGDQQLDEAARRLQEAAQAMRNAAARGGNAGVAESARALDRLQDAQRRLQRARENRVTEDAQNALDRVERLQQEQAEISRAVEDMPEDPSARTEVVERLKERKTSMAEEVGSLQRDMKRLSADARQEDPEAARAIDDAANAIEEGNLTAKILYSRGVVEQREKELARVFERGLEEDLEALRKKVENAAKVAQGLADAQGMEEALDRAQDLVQGVESLNERMQNRDRGEERDSLAEGGAAGQRRLGDRPGEQGEQQQGQGGQQQGQQGGQQQGQQGSQQQGQQGGQQQGQQGGQQQGQQGGQQQGQGGQQGGQQQGGQQGRGGNADVLGGSFNGGATRGSPRPYTDEEIRQFRREFQQRYADAQALRDALRQQGQDTQDLDRALDALRQLQVDETYGDLPQIAALRGQLTESLGRLEFSLRRQVEGEDTGRAALRGSDDVPPGFRKLVEEYYRALARGNGNGGGGQR